jgi:hypothetical protein
MNAIHNNETHFTVEVASDGSALLSDDQLSMITGGGEESMPMAQAGFWGSVGWGVLANLVYDVLTNPAPPEGNQSPGPADGAHGAGGQ